MGMVHSLLKRTVTFCLFVMSTNHATAAESLPLDDHEEAAAAANYQRFCALCHGRDRQGYTNDNAPSLRSPSLVSSGTREIFFSIAYGRFGTAMAAYLDEVGGPMNGKKIRDLTRWLQGSAQDDSLMFSYSAVSGDLTVGARVYASECASCHGRNGEGGIGTALGNQVMLSLTSDGFLRYAIERGREGTDMPAFGETLTAEEIDGVTAFLRSRALGWAVEKPVLRTPPAVGDYVLNPRAQTVEFELKDGLYVTSDDLLEALEQNRRLVLLDTRATSQWQMVHIEGSVPIPYYYDYADLRELAEHLPDDDTMIVTYCACPRAAAEYVNGKLREIGLSNTAVLWEGIGGWVGLGYPVSRGETTVIARENLQ